MRTRPRLFVPILLTVSATWTVGETALGASLNVTPEGCWDTFGTPEYPQARILVDDDAGHGPRVMTAVTDGAGGAYLVWQARSGGSYVTRIDNDGVIVPPWPPGGVNVGTGPALFAVADGTGGVYVIRGCVFSSGCVTTTAVGRHFQGDGSPAPGWPAGGVEFYTPDFAPRSFHADGAGGLIVVGVKEQAFPPPVTAKQIRVRRFDATGGTPAPWPADGVVALTYQEGVQEMTGAVGDDDGSVYLAWDIAGTNGDGFACVRDGQLAWTETIPSASGRPPIVADGLGDALTWTNGLGGRMLRYSPSGRTWDAPVLSGILTAKSDGTGGVLFVRHTGSDYRLFRLDAAGTTPAPWPASGVPVAPAQSEEFAIVPDLLGGALVASQNRASFGWDMVAHSFTGTGAPAPPWPAEGIVLHTFGGPPIYAIWSVPDGEGGHLFLWTDEIGVGIGQPYSMILGQRLCNDAPVPVALSFAGEEYTGGVLRLRWHAAEGAAASASVERREEDDGAWSAVGDAPLSLDGDYVFDDANVQPGQVLDYRLVVTERSQTTVSAAVRVTIPAGAPALSLALGRQPARPGDAIRFALHGTGSARLEMFDARGRRAWAEPLDGLPAGEHELFLPRGITTGVYWLRLTEGTESRSARFVLLD